VIYPSTATATIVVRAPDNVAVSVDGKDLPPAEPERRFVSPPLEMGKSQVYTVRLKWTEDGREVTQEEHITVQAGGRKSLTILPSSTKQAPRMPSPRK
jgi:uncharacterized protein (TIGR03000 family)